jgi:hypothetical protein
MRTRNLIGSLLALVGAAATLISPWQSWYNNRHGSSYKFYEVFGTGITVSRSGIMDSVFLVFLVTTIVAVIGVVMRSRMMVLGAGVVAFGFTILWMIRQGQAANELVITGANNRGLGSGLAWAFGGGILMIAGALVMTGRRERAVVTDRAVAADRTAAPAATTQGTAAAATTAAAPTITTTAPADKNRAGQQTPAGPAPAPTASTESTETPAATTGSGAERTGTERLSKEERQLLGLDEDADASAQQKPKSQN